MDIGSSFFKAELTGQELDLILDLNKDAEVVGLDEDVPAVFKSREQTQGLFKVERDAFGRML